MTFERVPHSVSLLGCYAYCSIYVTIVHPSFRINLAGRRRKRENTRKGKREKENEEEQERERKKETERKRVRATRLAVGMSGRLFKCFFSQASIAYSF